MLLSEANKANVKTQLNCDVTQIEKIEDANNNLFSIAATRGRTTENIQATSLVIACGGLSIPKMCATPFGYKVAEQFDHHIWPTSAGLVPFTLHLHDKERFLELTGISVDCIVSNERNQFRENILFTHRGLSGPAMLQISSFWKPGEAIHINLLPEQNLADVLKARQAAQSNMKLKTVLGELLPKRLLPALLEQSVLESTLQTITHSRFNEVAQQLQDWQIKPNATEGYRTAEVTLGGVDCDELSSKTMESNKVPGLYFIGEVVDVTGWLGGYNFQWAWSSGWCAGQVV